MAGNLREAGEEVTCHTCQQPIHTLVDHLYGRRSYRCGCGTLSRRDPPPPEPKQHKGNGFMSGGVFYGTCLNPACRREFESEYPRQSCLRDACMGWLKVGRHNTPEAMQNRPVRSIRPCRFCQQPFEGVTATVCKADVCRAKFRHERRPIKVFRKVCRGCNAPFTVTGIRVHTEYCSRDCRRKAKRVKYQATHARPPMPCVICETLFTPPYRQGHKVVVCSVACAKERRRRLVNSYGNKYRRKAS